MAMFKTCGKVRVLQSYNIYIYIRVTIRYIYYIYIYIYHHSISIYLFGGFCLSFELKIGSPTQLTPLGSLREPNGISLPSCKVSPSICQVRSTRAPSPNSALHSRVVGGLPGAPGPAPLRHGDGPAPWTHHGAPSFRSKRGKSGSLGRAEPRRRAACEG